MRPRSLSMCTTVSERHLLRCIYSHSVLALAQLVRVACRPCLRAPVAFMPSLKARFDMGPKEFGAFMGVVGFFCEPISRLLLLRAVAPHATPRWLRSYELRCWLPAPRREATDPLGSHPSLRRGCTPRCAAGLPRDDGSRAVAGLLLPALCRSGFWARVRDRGARRAQYIHLNARLCSHGGKGGARCALRTVRAPLFDRFGCSAVGLYLV